MSRYYTTAQAAEYLGYKPRSIRRFVSEGKLIPENQVGHPRFTQIALDAFLRRSNSHKRPTVQVTTVSGLNPLLQAALSK
jgi:hypothetical protein